VWGNEVDTPSPMGEINSKRVKTYKIFLQNKVLFSRTSHPISIKVGTHNSLLKEIQIC
jgi:hypothetical protein